MSGIGLPMQAATKNNGRNIGQHIPNDSEPHAAEWLAGASIKASGIDIIRQRKASPTGQLREGVAACDESVTPKVAMDTFLRYNGFVRSDLVK